MDSETDRVVDAAPILRRHLVGLNPRQVMTKMANHAWHQEYVAPCTNQVNPEDK